MSKNIMTRRLTPNELTEILFIRAQNELKDNPESYAFFILSLGAGLRAEEVPLIRWGDLKDGILDIPSVNLENGHSIARSIPVCPGAIEELESLRPNGVNPDDFIVTCVNSKNALREKCHLPRCRTAYRQLSRWLRQQGLPPKPIALLRKLNGFRIMSGGDPDSFNLAARYLGLSDQQKD